MGDSITDAWQQRVTAGFFPGKPYVDRGISGQTTPQMLLRFRTDVIDLGPKAVVILAGTNDIAGNTGPMTKRRDPGQPGIHERAGARAQHPFSARERDTGQCLPRRLTATVPQTTSRPMARIQALNDWMRRTPHPRRRVPGLLFRNGPIAPAAPSGAE